MPSTPAGLATAQTPRFETEPNRELRRRLHRQAPTLPIIDAVSVGSTVDPCDFGCDVQARTLQQSRDFLGTAFADRLGFLQQRAVAEQVRAAHAGNFHAGGTDLFAEVEQVDE